MDNALGCKCLKLTPKSFAEPYKSFEIKNGHIIIKFIPIFFNPPPYFFPFWDLERLSSYKTGYMATFVCQFEN